MFGIDEEQVWKIDRKMIEGSIFRIIRVLIRNEQRKREMIDFRIINKIAIYFLLSFCTRKQETSRKISVKYLIELKKNKKKNKKRICTFVI